MTIEKTFNRKTKKNHYERFFIQDGLVCYYVFCNLGEITWVRERIYKDETEEEMKERTIKALPAKYIAPLTKLITATQTG